MYLQYLFTSIYFLLYFLSQFLSSSIIDLNTNIKIIKHNTKTNTKDIIPIVRTIPLYCSIIFANVCKNSSIYFTPPYRHLSQGIPRTPVTIMWTNVTLQCSLAHFSFNFVTNFFRLFFVDKQGFKPTYNLFNYFQFSHPLHLSYLLHSSGRSSATLLYTTLLQIHIYPNLHHKKDTL